MNHLFPPLAIRLCTSIGDFKITSIGDFRITNGRTSQSPLLSPHQCYQLQQTTSSTLTTHYPDTNHSTTNHYTLTSTHHYTYTSQDHSISYKFRRGVGISLVSDLCHSFYYFSPVTQPLYSTCFHLIMTNFLDPQVGHLVSSLLKLS